ncbi:MAG TPA: Asp-tRNA(Asn)/Glu-tRNA(Gln) amidotransferase subunit GatC [Lacibacter sp.]|nr:Asp-tRNA(Asn)/Glu-tRNA(Gln) amidotransferase subunit GatC [Lacibacter sp.]
MSVPAGGEDSLFCRVTGIRWRVRNDYLCHMEVTRDLVEQLSRLARLQVPPAQREPLRNDLQQMIGFIEKLQELDTTGVEPLQHLTSVLNQLRPDVVASPLDRSAALQQAGLHDDQYFLVPTMIKKQ